MSLIYIFPVNAISIFSTLYLQRFSFIDESGGIIKLPSDILTNWIFFLFVIRWTSGYGVVLTDWLIVNIDIQSLTID